MISESNCTAQPSLFWGELCRWLFYFFCLNLFIYFRCADGDEEEDKEVGWKYVHGDVFRHPPNLSLFCAVLGVGTQLLTLYDTFNHSLNFLNSSYQCIKTTFAIYTLSSIIRAFRCQGTPY